MKAKIKISDDEGSDNESEDDNSNEKDNLKENLNNEVSNSDLLATIQEETEEEISKETFDFDFSFGDFEIIAEKITRVVAKIKKVLNLFQKSNDLTRVLLTSQRIKEPLNLLHDESEKKLKHPKSILSVIQDIITR